MPALSTRPEPNERTDGDLSVAVGCLLLYAQTAGIRRSAVSVRRFTRECLRELAPSRILVSTRTVTSGEGTASTVGVSR